MTTPAYSHYYRQVQAMDAAAEDQAVRLLLLGNCQECALFEVPPEGEDRDYGSRVMETILALANSFGGWLIFGVSAAWLGNLKAPGHGGPLRLGEVLNSPPAWLGPGAAQKLEAAVQPLTAQQLFGEPGARGLGEWLTASRLRYTTYARRWNRPRSESVERLLQTPFLSTYELNLPRGGSLVALRVRPLIDGELRHADIKGGRTVIRIGEVNRTRANLNGVNWAIYQALRLPYEAGGAPAAQLERFFFGDATVELSARVRVRALAGEFLNTLRPARRLDLAMELTGRCWERLGDRELFRAALDILYTAELGGRHVNERFWRDHVVHTLYTLLLGIYLWNTCEPLRERLETRPQGPLIWAMTATCHDLGYPFELFVVNLMSQLQGLAPYAAEELPVLPRIKDLGKTPEASYWQLISRQLWPDFDTDPPLLEIMFDAKSQNHQAHLLDHGIISALLWLALVAKVNDRLPPPHGPAWVLEAAGAMAAHNLRASDLATGAAQGQTGPLPILHVDRHPFAILLALCDCLQEWDRMAAARHVLIPGAVQVEVSFEPQKMKSEITARFGLDTRTAQAIGEGFDPHTGWFALGDRMTLSTESFTRALTVADDTTRRTATQDPWMVKDPVPEFLMQFDFAKFGTVLSGPEPGKVYLDTGNLLENGVIDNHAQPQLPGTARLVFEHPGYVEDHVGHLAPGEVTLVLHENPDFDAITAAFFCQELLLRGRLPEAWRPLARYVDLADRDRLPLDWDFPGTPRGIFQSFLRTAPRRRKPKHFTDLHRVRRGFMVLRYLTGWLEREVQDPEADPLLCFREAFQGAHPFETLQMEAGPDYDVFREMLARGEAYALELELPRLPFPEEAGAPLPRQKSRVLVCPESSRSFFLPQWAALEGYDGTVIHKRRAQPGQGGQAWRPGDSHFGSISREGGVERISFWGLGHLLDEKEGKARAERGGPRRSTDDGRRRPPNYPNEDPWYDSREGETPGSILAAPREGTYLTVAELEACLINTATWIGLGERQRATDLNFEKSQAKG